MIAAGRFIKLGKGVVGTAAKTKQPVLVQDVSTNPDWIYNPLLPETEAELAVPVILGEQVLGVLDVQSNIPNGLDKQDTDLLLAIAGQVSIALNNARSYANLRQKAHFEERISSIGQKIQASPTIESVLQIATRELGVALNAKSTTIQLENPSRIVSNDFQRERKANK
jgi:GAF domain-containing protein